MMRRIHTVLMVFAIFVPTMLAAQVNLPSLPGDTRIKSGKLPNGMQWYFCQNKAAKGLVSMSLIQKADPEKSLSDLHEEASARFMEVYFATGPLENFLARCGVVAPRRGYIGTAQGAVRFDFNNFSLARGEAVLDSLLFAVLTLATVSGRDGQSSTSQAVAIAGDVDEGAVISKLKLLSMMYPYSDYPIPEASYQWVERDSSYVPFSISPRGSRATVSVRWRMARTPGQYMSTALPVISDKLSNELGWVLRSRLSSAYRDMGIPVRISCRHYSSTDGGGDENITLSIHCNAGDTVQVKETCCDELRRLRSWGVDQVEYTYVRDAYRYQWLSRSKEEIPDNSAFIDKCYSSFVYSLSPASEESKMKFAYRDLPDSTQTRLFNNYMFNLLDQTSVADTALSPVPALVEREVIEHSLDASVPAYVLKAPKDKQEYMTGGQIWTFSGGVTVIYKKMNTRGQVHYSYNVRGGRNYADKDKFLSIDGIYGDNLSNYLASCGIEMNSEFCHSDVRITGKAPSENFDRVLKIITALSASKANDKVLGAGLYKLLILVGDVTYEDMKKMLCRYIYGFRPSGRWTSGAMADEETPSPLHLRSYVLNDLCFRYDLTSPNYVLADVASHALMDAMTKATAQLQCVPGVSAGFVGFPSDRYRLTYGVLPLKLADCVDSGKSLSRLEYAAVLHEVFSCLSSKEVPNSSLNVYKALALNAFKTYKTTAQYYIDIARNRYMDNRDLTSKYETVLSAIKPVDLKLFFSDAAASSPNW